MTDGMERNNNSDAMSVLSVSAIKAGVLNQGNKSRTKITANKKDKTSNRPNRYTAIGFVVNMKGALLSIGELIKRK
jgi:hypothetical protein